MKKNNKLLIIILFLLLTLTSCDLTNINNTVYTKDSDSTVVQINNSITDVVSKVDSSCCGVYVSNNNQASTGSAIIYKKEGIKYYAITNYHVISLGYTNSYFSGTVEVYVNNTTYIKAKVEGINPNKDLACLSFEANDKYNIGYTTISNDEILITPGETVIAIGCPLGLTNFNTVTTGVVSRSLYNLSFTTELNTKSIVEVVQHDAAINSGNSGGALFNINGDLIGINFEKTTMSSSGIVVEGMGYAISINEVKTFLSTNSLE